MIAGNKISPGGFQCDQRGVGGRRFLWFEKVIVAGGFVVPSCYDASSCFILQVQNFNLFHYFFITDITIACVSYLFNAVIATYLIKPSISNNLNIIIGFEIVKELCSPCWILYDNITDLFVIYLYTKLLHKLWIVR